MPRLPLLAAVYAAAILQSPLQSQSQSGSPSDSDFQTIPAATWAEMTVAQPDATPVVGPDWTRSNGGDTSNRYSTLKQIDRSNVSRLAPAWTYHSKDGASNVQANAVIVNGIVYAPTAGHFMVALDGATGKELWRFHPQGSPAFRGLIYWPGDERHAARLYFPSGEWLYALDAATGQPSAGFGNGGRVPGRSKVAPAIYRNLVILPCWNVVRAFDLFTGEERWNFHVVPRFGEPNKETWSVPGFGANIWGGMALDPARGIAYVSTGSPHPNYLGMLHKGDNLYANCVVALKADTGEKLWHFQEIQHDIWDLDIPAPPNLVTVLRDGIRYDAVAQVTKLGNTLLLDRLTGKPLFPFRRRRAPSSILPGESTASWQPALELPQPFAPQEFSLEDVTDVSATSRDFVMSRIANTDFGWFRPFRENVPLVFYGMHGGAEWTGASFDPEKGWLYVSANKLPWVVKVARVPLPPNRQGLPPTLGQTTYLQYCGGCHGVKRDGQTSAPQLFVPAMRSKREQLPGIIRNGRGAMPPIPVPEEKIPALIDYVFGNEPASEPTTAKEPQAFSYAFAGYSELLDEKGRPGVKPPWGTLNAINLSTGKTEWRVPLGEYADLTRQGVPKTGTENFGGSTVTAGGLVFCAGTVDLKLRAFDSQTGRELWEYQLPFGGFAPPAVYEAAGKQYVLIAATGGGMLGGQMGDVWIAFALPPDAKAGVQRSASH